MTEKAGKETRETLKRGGSSKSIEKDVSTGAMASRLQREGQGFGTLILHGPDQPPPGGGLKGAKVG